MTRKKITEPWSVDNVIIITREQHSRIQSALAHSGYSSPAQLRRRARLGLPLKRRQTGRKQYE
jgi:hypothetical protein